MKKYLDKNAILGTTLRTTEMEVKPWGGWVTLREPSAAVTTRLNNLPDGETKNAFWAVLCAVDENGALLFSEDDVPAMADKSGLILTRIVNKMIDDFGLGEKKAPSEVANELTSE